jgi:hypothetical protein
MLIGVELTIMGLSHSSTDGSRTCGGVFSRPAVDKVTLDEFTTPAIAWLT